MKVVARTTMAILALLLGSGTVAAQQGDIVYLDSERLRQEAPGLQAAGQRMQQEMARLEAEADSALAPLQAELQRMQAALQQQGGMMTPEVREREQQALQQKQAEFQQAGSQWERRAGELQSEILGPALQRINEVIDTLRTERGYAFIFDAAAGGVVAADPALDITDEVLRRLNSGGGSGS